MTRLSQIDQEASLETSLTLTGRLRSFRCAIRGITVMVQSQRNAWIHAIATCIVCAAGAFFGLSRSEWCWIVLAIVVVWMAEALNTAFELLADFASPTFHPIAGKAKDVAAGAVLIAALGATVIGILIMGPHIITLFRK
jgi:diacylglycerol kinase